MWHALKAELAYFRSYVLGGLGLAVGVVVIVSVVFAVVGENGPPSQAAAGMRGMFLIMAPLITGFVVQALRTEERRSRLLMTGPLTPRQLGGVSVLLPTVLLGVGIVGAGLMLTLEAVITGRFALESLHIVGFVGGQLFVYSLLGLLAQEATAAHAQQRGRAAAGAWACFGVAVVLLAGCYLALAQQLLTWSQLILGHLVVAAAAMAATVMLYSGRVDFTR